MQPAQEIITGLAEHLIRPIMQELMQDPVFATDGHTYERQATILD